MSEELRGEWKLLKVWECHRCKVLIRVGGKVSDHKCEIRENELSISNKIVEEQKTVIEDQKKTIENQKAEIKEQDKLIENQKNAIGSHKGTIRDQKKIIEDQCKTTEYYKKTIESQNVVKEEQNKFIKDKTAEDQYKIIEDQKKTIEGYRRAIDSQKKSIDERYMTIDSQNKIIESQRRIIRDKEIEEKMVNKNLPKINNKDNGGIRVRILEDGKNIRDSKDTGYREDIEIEVIAKGRGRDRIIIKNGRLIKKPDDIEIIGEQTSEGFVMKGIYKN